MNHNIGSYILIWRNTNEIHLELYSLEAESCSWLFLSRIIYGINIPKHLEHLDFKCWINNIQKKFWSRKLKSYSSFGNVFLLNRTGSVSTSLSDNTYNHTLYSIYDINSNKPVVFQLVVTTCNYRLDRLFFLWIPPNLLIYLNLEFTLLIN